MNDNEKEAKAFSCVDTRAKLRKRINETKDCLVPEWRKLFRNYVLDFDKRRATTRDGDYYLQWRIRPNPAQPESYSNQQTTNGTVILCAGSMADVE